MSPVTDVRASGKVEWVFAMAYRPYDYNEADAIYERRSDLSVDGFTMVRIRVAIKVYRNLWRKRPMKQTRGKFVLWIMQWLDEMRAKGTPHPLHFELVRCAKDHMQTMSGQQTYAELLRGRGQRAVHKVRYGGRR